MAPDPQAVSALAGASIAALLLPRQPSLVWREANWPDPLETDGCISVLRQIAADRVVRRLVVEIDATVGAIVYRIGAPEHTIRRVSQLFEALVPGTVLTKTAPRPKVTLAWRITASTQHRPLATREPENVTRAILAALASTRTGERVIVQWLLGPAQSPRPIDSTTRSNATEHWWSPMITGSATPLTPDRRKALQEKHADHSYACVARLGIVASTDGRAKALALGVLGGLRIAETPGVRLDLRRENPAKLMNVAVPWRWPLRLNAYELLGLLAWPLGDRPLPGVPRNQSRRIRADERICDAGRVIAEATSPGDRRDLGLSIKDAMFHLAVLGPTGTGKSTLLANLIRQDIVAGRGVVVIDPKGDLVDDVLAHVPGNRIKDVVVLDPADREYAVGLNPLAAHVRNAELVADQVLATFHGLYESSWGPRTQDILHAALLTLASRGDATLCALPALLTNPSARRRFRSGVEDPIALDPFWAWFESLSDGERQQAIAPVMNKTRPFLLRRNVRAIVGQTTPRFHMSEVFTHKRIVLVSLAKGLIGPEAAALFGSLVVAELWQAALGRAAVSAGQRHPVAVYADEFQTYTRLPTDLADALAQSRGLGLGWVLAHQHLAQLPHAIKSAVLANARSRVIFQLAADDAHAVARSSGGALTSDDLERLPRHEVYAQLVVEGEVTGFASGRTSPLPPPISDPRQVREASQLRFARPVAEVDAEITRTLRGEADVEADRVGRRRKGPST